MADEFGEEDLAEEIAREEVATKPNDVADAQEMVDAKIPQDIRDRFEVFSYRNAAVHD